MLPSMHIKQSRFVGTNAVCVKEIQNMHDPIQGLRQKAVHD